MSEQNDKLKEQNERLKVCEQTIEGLKVENETLKVKIECKTVAYNSLKQVYTQTKGLAQAAFQKSNSNEQYSRKKQYQDSWCEGGKRGGNNRCCKEQTETCHVKNKRSRRNQRKTLKFSRKT